MGLAEDVKGSASWEATQCQLDFSFYLFFFLGSFVLPDPQFILFGSSMGSVDCVVCVFFSCIPYRFLGRCMLEDVIESTEHDTSDDWNWPFQFEFFQGRLDI